MAGLGYPSSSFVVSSWVTWETWEQPWGQLLPKAASSDGRDSSSSSASPWGTLASGWLLFRHRAQSWPQTEKLSSWQPRREYMETSRTDHSPPPTSPPTSVGHPISFGTAKPIASRRTSRWPPSPVRDSQPPEPGVQSRSSSIRPCGAAGRCQGGAGAGLDVLELLPVPE